MPRWPRTRAETAERQAANRHIGSRLRMGRIKAEISQEALGKKLGVTFQQIQKYEKGTNRVSAATLIKVAQVLDVPIGFFYEGLAQGNGETRLDRITDDLLATRDGQWLITTYAEMPERFQKLTRDVIQCFVQAMESDR